MSDRELEALVPPDGFSQLLHTYPDNPLLKESPSVEARLQRKRQKTEEELPTRPQVKAQREKARREKMNQRFTSLAKLSNPEEPKTDKASILLDALVSLKSLKMENDQLRQLNKFLEEKVMAYEKERSFAIYRQSSLLNSGATGSYMCPGMLPHSLSTCNAPEGTVVGMPVLETDATAPSDLGLDTELEEFLHPPAA